MEDKREIKAKKSQKKQVHLFYCVECEELARKVAAQSDLITLQSINWRFLILNSLFSLFLSTCVCFFFFNFLCVSLALFSFSAMNLIWGFFNFLFSLGDCCFTCEIFFYYLIKKKRNC